MSLLRPFPVFLIVHGQRLRQQQDGGGRGIDQYLGKRKLILFFDEAEKVKTVENNPSSSSSAGVTQYGGTQSVVRTMHVPPPTSLSKLAR